MLKSISQNKFHDGFIQYSYKLVRSFYLPKRLLRAYWRALSERIRWDHPSYDWPGDPGDGLYNWIGGSHVPRRGNPASSGRHSDHWSRRSVNLGTDNDPASLRCLSIGDTRVVDSLVSFILFSYSPHSTCLYRAIPVSFLLHKVVSKLRSGRKESLTSRVHFSVMWQCGWTAVSEIKKENILRPEFFMGNILLEISFLFVDKKM